MANNNSGWLEKELLVLPERMAQAAVLRAQNRAAHKVSTVPATDVIRVCPFF